MINVELNQIVRRVERWENGYQAGSYNEYKRKGVFSCEKVFPRPVETRPKSFNLQTQVENVVQIQNSHRGNLASPDMKVLSN